jgi:superfamily I DNA/RNA helicase
VPLPDLDGRQHHVAFLKSTGHQVVQGTAGSGKTVMAILRAGYLARAGTENSGKTLLVTHTNALVKYLRHLAEGEVTDVTIETYSKFARGYLSALGLIGYNSIAKESRTYRLTARAELIAENEADKFYRRTDEFFEDELDWISGSGLTTLEMYLAASRVGRKEALRPAQREKVWTVRERYIAIRNANGKTLDWASVPTALNNALRNSSAPRRYRHIVVDEAQDLSPEAIRSLVASLQDGGSLTLFVDESQQIYGQRTSWRSCGLEVSRVESFTDNYRNTPEIARIALAMASMEHFNDSADIVMPVTPRRAAGAKPTLYKGKTHASLKREMIRQATELGKVARVAVLASTRLAARSVAIDIPHAQQLHKDMPRWDDGSGVYYGTFHAAKGLEFEMVVIPYAENTDLPSPEQESAFGTIEARARASRKLYVGVTRARSELLVGYVNNLTPLLPPPSDDLWARVLER